MIVIAGAEYGSGSSRDWACSRYSSAPARTQRRLGSAVKRSTPSWG
ncbi:hypothetical protein CVS29_09650 [Arthrobacter psychrochitiniphilus]|uniref:Aconitase A/isopropylmalate dehydratase small subunit swivel domain-containing protein n=1 Tax=Arthrobacter psychrochitiniphilus TaxID=291045 RepID=A0A2V3DR91_9MICC|nr:hypothetical protein CVS29_09650 [Arthrobacter psychrochitiniphilus]